MCCITKECANTISTVDILTIAISIIALLVSIISIISGNKNNKVNLKASNFHSLYDDYMLKKIPLARRRIEIDKRGKLVGFDELDSVLMELKHDSIYYRYIDKDYYEKLSKKLADIQDYFYDNEKKIFDCTEIPDVMKTIEEKIASVYEILNGKYEKG